MTAKTTYYFHKNWSIDTNPPGLRVGVLGALLITPILGALFLMFLPFIGFALVIQAIALKAAKLAKPLFQTSLSPLPAPGEAHLTGHPGKEHGEMMDAALDEIAKEVQERRARK